MREFSQIFYGKERPAPKPEPKQPLAEKLQPHGMPLINFTLTEHLIDEKVQAVTEKIVGRTQDKMVNEVKKKTDDLRKHMDGQFRRSQRAMLSMQTNIDNTNKNVVMQIRQSHEDMLLMKDQLSQSVSRGDLPELPQQEAQKVAVPFEIDGEEFTLELNNIRGIEVVDLEAPQDDGEDQQSFNILD